jgi:transcriptional regulator with XRE-family HTH domain
MPAGGRLTELVAEEVRALCARRQISQGTLGKVLGISAPQVSMRLRGLITFSVDELGILANYFGVSPAVLVGGIGGSPTPQGLPRLGSNQQPFGHSLNPLGYDPHPSLIVPHLVRPVMNAA